MKKKQKITYEIDRYNRLVAKKTGSPSGAARFRQVIDGQFQTDKNNSLAYHIKKSSDIDTPQQVRLSGKYALDKDRNLVLTLNKWNNQVEGNKLTIKGQLLDAREDELSFLIGTRDSASNGTVYILKLYGAWQADKDNRLRFNVTREKGGSDALTLEGAWQVNNNNEISYTHAKARLKTKEKIIDALSFKGHWDITEKNRISYILNKAKDSRFDFEAAFVRAAKSGMEYQVKIGSVPALKRFTLHGEWKVDKKLGLLFEVPYGDGKARGIVFGASLRLGRNNTLELRLKNRHGQDMGVSVRVSDKILKDQGEAYIQALKEGKELSLLAGIGFRW